MRQMGIKARMGVAFLLSLLITGVYFFFVYQRLPFIYEINDDVAMRNVAAGVITGEPDAHLIFVKYILGLFISGLYRIFPGFDWYGIVMIGIILLSFAVILYRGLLAEKSLVWKGLYTGLALLLFTCIGLQHMAAFQWTMTAAFAGAAGVFLFYTSDTEDRFQMIWEEGTAVFLLLLCLAVRRSVFFMVLPVAGICFWWKYGSFRRNGKWSVRLRHWMVPVALACGVVIIIGAERLAYRSEEWKEFLSYNVDRSDIMDYYGLKNYEENQEFYDGQGLSPEEVENLQRYSLYLCEDLYPEKMHVLAANAREEHFRQNSVKTQMVTGVKKVLEHLTSDMYAPLSYLAYFAVIAVFILSWIKNKKQLALTLMVNGILAALWMYLGFRGRIVDRVVYGMFLLQFLTMLAIGWQILRQQEIRVPSRWIVQSAVLASCLVLTVLSARKWKQIEENVGWRSTYNTEFLDINGYMAEHMEHVYFMTTFSIETYTDNFTLRRDFDFSNLLSVGGWHTFSPLENEKKEKLGIDNAKEDIVKKDNVYLISLENVNLRYIDRYYTSLYGDEYLGRELADSVTCGNSVFEIYDFSVMKANHEE